MRFGPRRPSLRGRIAARTSLKRYVRHSLGVKAPRGYGWLTNPKKAAYNRVYNRTTFDLLKPSRSGRRPGRRSDANSFIGAVVLVGIIAWLIYRTL